MSGPYQRSAAAIKRRASLPDLKAFGQWWGPQGVTDAPAFDQWAAEVLDKLRTAP